MRNGERSESGGQGAGSPAGRLAREVSSMQARLLGKLHEELAGEDSSAFAAAAEALAEDFGAVTATAVDSLPSEAPPPVPFREEQPPSPAPLRPVEPEAGERHVDLYSQGEMRRRLDQLVECNKRYGYPFGLVVFDVDGPDARPAEDGRPQAALAIVAAALHDNVRLVDETYHVEGNGICVFAPQQTTVEGVRMAERLLGALDQVKASGGMQIGITAGVVACPEHGVDAQELLRKADEAMWRARAVGQPVGVGPLGSMQDR